MMTDNNQQFTIRSHVIGTLMYDARLAARWTPEECAGLLGISTEKYLNYEHGGEAPSLPELEILAYSLKIPMSHFWNRESLLEKGTPIPQEIDRLKLLRNRVIGARIRQDRETRNISENEFSQLCNITVEQLNLFENGIKEISIPQLEAILKNLDLRVEDMFDQAGLLGTWHKQHKALDNFSELPTELQDFISKPVNRPFIDLAIHLSELPVDKLRTVAEGLLEITY
jgi:transcriptional regulator with XRE-family HTH domain